MSFVRSAAPAPPSSTHSSNGTASGPSVPRSMPAMYALFPTTTRHSTMPWKFTCSSAPAAAAVDLDLAVRQIRVRSGAARRDPAGSSRAAAVAYALAVAAGAKGRRRRPVAVTLVAALALGLAVYSVVYAVLAIRSGEGDRLPDAIFHLLLGGGALAAALGSFRLAPWGWVALMTWAVVALTHQILRYLFFDDPNYADMAVSTFAVLALSPLDVQIAFGLRHTENVRPGRSSRNPVERD